MHLLNAKLAAEARPTQFYWERGPGCKLTTQIQRALLGKLSTFRGQYRVAVGVFPPVQGGLGLAAAAYFSAGFYVVGCDGWDLLPADAGRS